MTRVTPPRRPARRAPQAPSAPTRQARKADTRRRIVEAAAALFVEEGFEAASTKAIARRAGVASGTVFLHAPDKEELLFLVMHDRLAQVVERAFATLPARAKLADQLVHVFGALYRFYASVPALGRPFVRATPGATGPNAQAVSALTFAFLGRVGTLVQAAQQRREIAKDVDAFQLAQNLFGLYFMGLVGWLNGYVSIEAALDPGLTQAIALQLRGLAPR